MYPAPGFKSIRHAAGTVESAVLAVVLRHYGLALREPPGIADQGQPSTSTEVAPNT
ncbi:MAG: hypothetical protein QOD66_4174 [Solirubrobacteraceae bacterium]|jgi:hypothetical protein|nr:hypothetical protein [Solirubrobacteraceae bacterium]